MTGTPPRVHVVTPVDVDGDEVARSVRDVVAELVRELALPVAPRADVTVQVGERWLVEVNGVRCRIPALEGMFRTSSAPVQRAADAVRLEAQLLLTDDVVTALVGGVGPPADPVPRLLRELVTRGVRPGRLMTALRQRTDGDPLEAFEDAVRAASHPPLLRVDRGTEVLVEAEPDTATLWARSLSVGLFEELGLLIGPLAVEADESLAPRSATVVLNDRTAAAFPCLPEGRLLVNDVPSRLALLGVEAVEVLNPAGGMPAATVSAADGERLVDVGLTTWTPGGFLVLVAAAVVRRHAAALHHRDVVAHALRQLAPTHPVLDHLVRRAGGTTRVTRVLRRLLAEEVPVLDLPRIVGALNRATPAPAALPSQVVVAPGPYVPPLPAAGDDAEEAALAEAVRSTLARQIAQKHSRGTGTLVVYLLDPAVEQRLLQPAEITPDERDDLLDMVATEVAYLPPTASVPHLLVHAAARARLHQLVAAAHPRMAVLAYEDLPPDLNVQPIARLSLG